MTVSRQPGTPPPLPSITSDHEEPKGKAWEVSGSYVTASWPRWLASMLGPMAGTAENHSPRGLLTSSYDGSLQLSLSITAPRHLGLAGAGQRQKASRLRAETHQGER